MTDEEKLRLVKRYMTKWKKLLKMDCVNSKGMVRNDIDYVLKKLKEDK